VSRFVEHVKGYRVIAKVALLDQGKDWTARLQQAANAQVVAVRMLLRDRAVRPARRAGDDRRVVRLSADRLLDR
jgi:hypothetical protein